MKTIKQIRSTLSVFIVLLAITSIVYSKIDLIKAYARSNASLEFTETNITIEPGEKYSIPIKLDTKLQNVIGVDIVIKYDPKIIKVLGAGSLETFDNPVISDIDNKEGISRFHLLNNENNYVNGNKNILGITISGDMTGTTPITIEMKEDEVTKMPISHVTLDDKTDGLGIVRNTLIKVRFSDNPTTNKLEDYGITKDSSVYNGIQANNVKSTEKVLGASDVRNSKTQDITNILKNPVTIGIIIGILVLLLIGLKIYKAYKRSLEEEMSLD